MSLNTITVTNVRTLVLAANPKRKSWRLTIKNGTVATACGPTAGDELTFANGTNLEEGANVSYEGPGASFAVWAITESDSAVVSYEEYYI